jgi:hypothetical protein
MEEAGRRQFTLYQRLFAYILMISMPVLLGWLSVRIAQMALALSDAGWWIRGPLLVLSGLLMLLALRLVVSLLRRKWKTGRFLLTGAEVAARQAEYRSRMGAGKPFWPQARCWIIPFLLITMLVVVGLGTIFTAFCLYRDRALLPLPILLVLLGAVLLALPARLLFKAIRRKLKTGSFLPSEQELAARRSRCAKPKSLRQRIALAAVWWFSAILWTDMAIGRQHHQGSAWVAAGMTWLAAFAWTWRVFRPSPSQCALPVAPQEPPRD